MEAIISFPEKSSSLAVIGVALGVNVMIVVVLYERLSA